MSVSRSRGNGPKAVFVKYQGVKPLTVATTDHGFHGIGLLAVTNSRAAKLHPIGHAGTGFPHRSDFGRCFDNSNLNEKR